MEGNRETEHELSAVMEWKCTTHRLKNRVIWPHSSTHPPAYSSLFTWHSSQPQRLHPMATLKQQWHLSRKADYKTSKETKPTSTLIQVQLVIYNYTHTQRLFPISTPIIMPCYSSNSAKHYTAAGSCSWLNNCNKNMLSIFSTSTFSSYSQAIA